VTIVRVAHLYPDYLNIYADRGNIAVLVRRAALRGHELDVKPVGLGEPFAADAFDLVYIGGGQDREQLLVARDLTTKAPALREASTARRCRAPRSFHSRRLRERHG
jgi:CobQ-like glutamine amidotransferase family enzyme